MLFGLMWRGEAVGKMATKRGRGPSQNTVGAHCELSRLRSVKGQMEMVEGELGLQEGEGKRH